MHGFRAKLDYLLKHNDAFYKVFNVVVSFCMRFVGIFVPIDKKMILFSAHSRKYNDSPKAIYEYMISKPEYAGYKYVWALEDPEYVELPGPAIKIKADTPQYFIVSMKAKYWITCVNIERHLHYKKKNQVYLNTWHGCSINHCGNAVPGRSDFDFSAVDYMCYESEYHKEILMRDFLAREEAMIPTGLPRNDSLYCTTSEEILVLKKKLGLPLDKRIILYAPTWRDSTDNGQTYAITPPINVEYWQKELQEEYVVLLRTHAYTNKLLGVDFNDFIRDFTNYHVINDLFKVADILISDYSSCIADFSILERPIICFAYDYEEYCRKRGLYLDMEKDMPSGVKRTEQEVIEQIKSMNYEDECRKSKEMIKERITNIGGHATEICVRKMFGLDLLNTAVIMAAGMGTRFGVQTEMKPKGFVPFKGVPMIERTIKTLIDCGISRIIIGTGYHKEYFDALAKKYPCIECVFSPRFAETNSMYTLWNCRNVVGDDDFILLESDLVFEKRAITSILECPFDSVMLITPVTKFQDQYYVQMNENNELIDCSVNKNDLQPSGELVGIHKIGNSFYKLLCAEYEKIIDEKPKLGYEFQLLDVSQRITPMNVLILENLQWYEIDDEQDLKYAEENLTIK